MLGQWRGVTVIGVETGRAGLDLVSDLAACGDGFPTIVLGTVGAMEVKIVGPTGAVGEVDPDRVSFGRPDGGAGDRPVVGPGLEEDPVADLDQLLLGRDLDVTVGPGGLSLRFAPQSTSGCRNR